MDREKDVREVAMKTRIIPGPRGYRYKERRSKGVETMMNKATHENKDGDGPSVFRFKARLFPHPEAAKTASSALLNVPKVVGKKLGGMTKVEGTMNDHPFRAALEPNPSGGHWLRVNKAMREGAGADVGDTVKLAILGPEPEPKVPADLHAAFTASPRRRNCGRTSRQWVVAVGSAGSSRQRVLRPGPAGSHGPSNSFPRESGALVV